MLDTPLGKIEVYVDDIQIEYKAESVTVDGSCSDLDGRYLIVVKLQPDGMEHKLSCVIKDHEFSKEDGIESGEMLELKSFYCGTVKLSIGMEGDSGYFADGTRLSESYDYDNDYLDNGVLYRILATTKTDTYRFGIAWINNCTENNEVQTWYGADTSLLIR